MANKKCSCYDDNIAGLSQDDMMLFAGAGVGFIGTGYLANMMQYDKDGNKKTGQIATNDTMRNGAYVVGGWGIAYMWGDEPLAKGAGIGMTVFGLKEIIRKQMPTLGITGLRPNGNEKYIGGGRRTTDQQKYIGDMHRNDYPRKTRKIKIPTAHKTPVSSHQEAVTIDYGY